MQRIISHIGDEKLLCQEFRNRHPAIALSVFIRSGFERQQLIFGLYPRKLVGIAKQGFWPRHLDLWVLPADLCLIKDRTFIARSETFLHGILTNPEHSGTDWYWLVKLRHLMKFWARGWYEKWVKLGFKPTCNLYKACILFSKWYMTWCCRKFWSGVWICVDQYPKTALGGKASSTAAWNSTCNGEVSILSVLAGWMAEELQSKWAGHWRWPRTWRTIRIGMPTKQQLLYDILGNSCPRILCAVTKKEYRKFGGTHWRKKFMATLRRPVFPANRTVRGYHRNYYPTRGNSTIKKRAAGIGQR